jgi:hypothetical protein
MVSPWRNNTLEVEKEKIMSEEMEDTCEVTVEEALQMESIFSQALMDVMVAKGLITEQEVLDRIEEIKKEIGFV